jgi:hypothetical protein
MENTGFYFIIFIVLVIVYYQYKSVSNVDGYYIPSWEDRQEIYKSKEKLARLQNIGVMLTRYMEEKYIIAGKHAKNEEVVATKRLVQYFLKRKTVLQENDTTGGEGNTSFTVNKGESIHMCLRDPVTKKLIQDDNIIDFVMLHELAHIACPAEQHEDIFWVYFKILLVNAEEAGLHVPQDYSQRPVQYCGIDVTYNPIFDSAL